MREEATLPAAGLRGAKSLLFKRRHILGDPQCSIGVGRRRCKDGESAQKGGAFALKG